MDWKAKLIHIASQLVLNQPEYGESTRAELHEIGRLHRDSAVEIRTIADALTARLAAAETENARLREALQDAWTDIGQWLQLARYQREQLDHDKTPCPTQDGIDKSEAVRAAISAALAAPAAVEPGPSRDELAAENERLRGFLRQKLEDSHEYSLIEHSEIRAALAAPAASTPGLVDPERDEHRWCDGCFSEHDGPCPIPEPREPGEEVRGE